MAEGVKRLSQLALHPVQGAADVALSGLAVDSREVRPGALFAALPGATEHGARHVAQALARGAVAVLSDPAGARLAGPALAAHPGVALVVAEAPREALARAAALFYAAQPEVMVAITGTNGKTSAASFTRQIWAALGHRAANFGTTGVEGAFAAPLSHTTPEPVRLHALLAQMAGAGVSHAAMEASSHGLDQRRLEGVRLAAAGFTSFSHDHLDYHGTLEAYFAAKARLFSELLPEEGAGVITLDDPRGPELAAIARARGCRVIGVGQDPRADLQLIARRAEPEGQALRLSWAGGPARVVHLPMIGGFQASNALVAAGLAIACGDAPEAVLDVLGGLAPVRGRMQQVARRAHGAPVFVDYAHTPAALGAALAALRPHVMGRIIVVFGAGGDRDRPKRPLMGQAAAEGADLVIVTDDNPRSEDPAAIRAAIMAGCPEAREVGDRAEAILRGVDALEPGDALLIAGKGHETGQIVGGDIFPFDDAEQASVAVAALDGGRA